MPRSFAVASRTWSRHSTVTVIPGAAQPTAADLSLLKNSDRAKPSAKIQARLAAASALTMPPGRPQSTGEDSGGPAVQGGWKIQIGAPDDPAKANALLIRARERNPSTLASASSVGGHA